MPWAGAAHFFVSGFEHGKYNPETNQPQSNDAREPADLSQKLGDGRRVPDFAAGRHRSADNFRDTAGGSIDVESSE